MAGAKKGQSPTGRVNNRLHDDEQFAVMRWFDRHRERVHEKMTYPEIIGAVTAETGVTVTKGNVEGAMRDFGLRVKPLPTAPSTRAGTERVTNPNRIVLTTLERYRLHAWADDNRDRIDRTMTYEDMIAEVKDRLGLVVSRNNLRLVLNSLGLRAKKNYAACPVGLTGTPDGEPAPGAPTTGRSGAYKRAVQIADLKRRVTDLEARLAATEGLLSELALQVARQADGPALPRLLK